MARGWGYHLRTVNELRLERRWHTYEIDGVVQPEPHQQSEFIVDGVGLGERFGFEQGRPWFGQTCFEEVPEARRHQVEWLRGLGETKNQFGSDRFVLYRCHCGSDYCGVISCEITRDEQTVTWLDVRFEDEAEGDEDYEPVNDTVIRELVFDAEQYDAVIGRHLESVDRGQGRE